MIKDIIFSTYQTSDIYSQRVNKDIERVMDNDNYLSYVMWGGFLTQVNYIYMRGVLNG